MSNILNGPIQSNGLGYVKANIDGTLFNKISTSDKCVTSTNPVMPASNINTWKKNVEEITFWSGINAVDINWNGAEIEDGVFITTTGELLSWVKNHLSNNSEQSNDFASKDYVDNKIGDLIGAAPETLDTLKEIADKLGDNDDAVAVLTNQISSKVNSEDVYTKEEVDAELNQLREENAALLERIQRLETIISNLDPNAPQEPGDESYSVIIPSSNEPLTPEEIAASINPEATKPETAQFMDMTELSNPTDTYLVYPLSWEIIENDQIVSPVIKDWNGFEIGFNINEDTPTVMVNDVEYRVSDIKLGKGQYIIEFK